MLVKTRGIVINYIRFKETSIIVRIFTEKHGLLPFIINGVRKSGSKNSMGLYQPLTLLDLIIFYKDNGSILRISEAHCSHPYFSIPFDFKKMTILSFLSELLQKTLAEGVEDDGKFNFIYNYLVQLDEEKGNIGNFHLYFLAELSRYLGFQPKDAAEMLGHSPASHEIRLVEALDGILRNERITIHGGERREILQLLLNYYQSHIENFGEMRSLAVLQEIM
ncbi:MAG: DNA repair protein RecO [Cytophagales bacterium]|nr:DNA repair protein RecO [Cytophagales bacterium]